MTAKLITNKTRTPKIYSTFLYKELGFENGYLLLNRYSNVPSNKKVRTKAKNTTIFISFILV
jgi:hypothetical protein